MRTPIAILTAGLLAFPAVTRADDGPTVVHFSFDSQESLEKQLQNDSAKWQPSSPGELTIQPAEGAPHKRANAGSLEFDGKTAIVHAELGEQADRLTGELTWEGFFLALPDNTYDTDGGIADRFVTQFINETPGSTRITVGLAAVNKDGPPVLCIALAGTANRHDGRSPVEPGVWHHFAVVMKGTGDYGKLEWYLDYELEGEVTLDGKSPRTTLPPAGREPLAIGARLKDAKGLDRGFRGLLDEIRLSSKPLEPAQFLRASEIAQVVNYDRTVLAGIYEDLPQPFDWNFGKLQARETIVLEALSISRLPVHFSERGFKIDRQGLQGMRAAHSVTLPAGEIRLLMRTESDALLTVDGQTLIDARTSIARHPLEPLPAGPRDFTATFTSDGKPHDFAVAAVYEAGPKKELGDVVVCYSKNGGADWVFLGHPGDLRVSNIALAQMHARTTRAYGELSPERKAAAIQRGNEAWDARHAQAREAAAKRKIDPPAGDGHPIDRFIDRSLQQQQVQPAPQVGDAVFARRLSLDLRGRIPTVPEMQAFLNDGSPDKRERLIDSMLSSDEWADGWVGYWQDVLAENPDILKPTLNNSGPFRHWIHRSFRRNLPLDRFATELILMEGSDKEAGAAGFALASNNDAPMAMKAHVVLQAFAAVDLQCARCHDSPVSALTQHDLFSVAALLNEKPVAVPSTSVVPPTLPGGRIPGVTASLKAGQRIEPEWTLDELIPVSRGGLTNDAAHAAERPRALLAETLTSPHSTRFSDVMVNRIWKRYMGTAFIEPVDNWKSAERASHPELLKYLSWKFVDSGYDVKQLVQMIVSSNAYQRVVLPPAVDGGSQQPTYAGQSRRRLTGEQVVDSLHVAVGRDFDAEELTFDPNRTRGFLNLGVPRRAWQMTSMSNERDRPALSMPVNQSIVDVLQSFGWRSSRSNPVTVRDHDPNPLQPLMMSNSRLSARLVRLTEDSTMTELCVEAESVEQLADRLFLATLSREPDEAERAIVVELLGPEFDKRLTGTPKPKIVKQKRAHVDWDKHLSPEASVELLEAERLARVGPPATVRLTPEFRERAEDALWCLLNTPEFVFVP